MSGKIESEAEYKKKEMLKKARKSGLQFSIDRGEEDGGLPIVDCNKRSLSVDKKGTLVFRQEETTKLIWTVIMTFLGALVPFFMFLDGNMKMRLMAGGIFLMFQAGAVATVNAGRPEIRFFDKGRGKYRIRRANHILTRLFRRTWLEKADLNKVTCVKLSSFTAKRWEARWMGSGEEKYQTRELKTYENYRLFLSLVNGDKITIYDWYDMDQAMEVGEEIAGYLGVEFSLE